MKYIKAIIFISALIVYAVLIQQNRFIQDDTFINFRYIDNFLNGNGLVYNSAEYVEGFTSLSWLIILIIVKALGFDLIIASQYLSIFFGAVVLLLIFLFSNRYKNSIYIFIANALLMISSLGFIYWTVSGMETSFFVLLVLLMVFTYISKENLFNNNYFFVVSFLAVITRHEAAALFFIILLYDYIINKSKYQLKENRKSFLIRIIVLFLLLLLLFLLRILYYGFPFPNTYYAKVNLILPYIERGFEYIYNFIVRDLLYGLLLIPLFIFFSKEKNSLLRLTLVLSAFYLVYIIYIGGDILPHNRFLLPVLPLIYLSISIFVFSNTSKQSLKILLVLIIIAASFIKADYQKDFIKYTREHEIGLVKKMKIYAEYLNERSDENSTATVSTIGSFGYYYKGNLVDMVGLTDKFIAHNPIEVKEIDENIPVGWKERTYNIDYIFSRKPDFIIFPAGYKPTAFPEAALFSDQRFINQYYVELLYSSELNQMLPFFVKRKSMLISNDTCSNYSRKWVIDFIKGNNLLLEFIKSKDESLIDKIEEYAQSIIKKSCRTEEGYLMIGLLRFHQGLFDESYKNFYKVYMNDPLNSFSIYYLMLISSKKDDSVSLTKFTRKLKEVSPGALPNMVLQ